MALLTSLGQPSPIKSKRPFKIDSLTLGHGWLPTIARLRTYGARVVALTTRYSEVLLITVVVPRE